MGKPSVRFGEGSDHPDASQNLLCLYCLQEVPARRGNQVQGAMAVTKFAPLGVPRPVTLSQPGPVVREASVPKVMTNQLVEDGLL